MYQIITTPNPALVKTAEPVKHFDKKFHEVIRAMEKTLLATHDPKGVGLAAPQVGLSWRLFLAKPTDRSRTHVYINPEIVSVVEAKTEKKKKKRLFEGCLSIPNIWGNVKRYKEITLKWQDMRGKTHEKVYRGFMSTIIQHELDHLNGILFTKHAMEQGEKLYKSYKNEKGEDEFEEVKI